MFAFDVGGHTHSVMKTVIQELDLFKKRPDLLAKGSYKVQCKIDVEVFGLFLNRLVEPQPIVNDENVDQLIHLCEEFGYSGLEQEFTAISGTPEARAKKILAYVQEEIQRHDVDIQDFGVRFYEVRQEIEALRTEITQLRNRLEKEVRDNKVLHSQLALKMNNTNALHRQLERKLKDTEAGLEEKIDSIDWSQDVQRLEDEIEAKATDIRGLREEVRLLKNANMHAQTQSLPPRPAVRTKELEADEYCYDPAKPLSGIIAHLTNECKGNVHDKGVVQVTASSVNGPSFNWDPKFAADLASKQASKCFASGDKEGSWICYNFNDMRVKPSSYSIRMSRDLKENPRSWVLEVSNTCDEADWEVIDMHLDEDTSSRIVPRHFNIENGPEEGVQYIRLRQTGKNQAGTNRLMIAGLEIFGTLLHS